MAMLTMALLALWRLRRVDGGDLELEAQRVALALRHKWAVARGAHLEYGK